VINVCANAGRIDQAEKLLGQFTSFATSTETSSPKVQENATPSTRTWNTLLSSCMTQGDFRKAKYFWLKMNENGIQPDIVSFNTLLNCYVRSSKKRTKNVNNTEIQDAVEAIFHKLWYDPNVTPNHITYLAIVNFWVNEGIPQRAEKFLLKMANESRKSTKSSETNVLRNDLLAPDRKLFHYVLTSWGEHKAPKKAEELLLTMADLSDKNGFDVRPNTETYNRLLNCWAKSMKVESGERAEVILREMEGLVDLGDNETTPDIFSYNSVLNAWSNSGDAAALTRIDKLILEMLLKGNPTLLPDSFSYGTWLKAISSCDETETGRRVKDVIRTMGIHEFKPNEYIRKKIESLTTTEKNLR